MSVDNGTTGDSSPTSATPGSPSFVFNGSVLTVHDGKARLTLVAGGQVDICGPAKFTLLQSGPPITLALNFGRIHLQLPASTSLRIFTPTMIATPLDIGGASRDITAGLDLNDSLCVLATSGAIRLEQQFTGEIRSFRRLGEFFPVGGKFGAGCGHAGKLRMHADARAVVAAAADSGDGLTSRDQLNVEQFPQKRRRRPRPRKRPPIETAAKAPRRSRLSN